MPDVSGSIVVTDQAGASSPSAGSLAGLRAFGSSDAVLGLERRTGALLEAMVARQRILDDVSADIAARREQARVAHDRAMAAIRQRRTDESERIERDARLAIEAAEETHRSRATDLEMRRVRKLSELQSARDEDLLKLTRGLEEALLMAEAMREAGEEAEKRKTRELGERLARAMDEARSLEEEAKAYIRLCRLPVPQDEAKSTATAGSAEISGEDEIGELLVKGREHLDAILSTRAARLIAGPAPFLLAFAVVLGAGMIGGASTLFDEARWALWAGGAALGALVLVVVTFIMLRGVALRAMRRVWTPFQADLAALRAARDRAEREHAEGREARLFRLRDVESAEEIAAHRTFDGPIAENPKTYERRLKRLLDAVDAETKDIESERASAIAAADSNREADRAANATRSAEAERVEVARAKAEAEALAAEEVDRLREARLSWIRTATESRDALAFAESLDRTVSQPWSALGADGGIATERSPWFRFGTMTVEPASLAGGLPAAEEFRVEMPKRFEIPAALGFPIRGNLVFETTPESRGAALQAVQALLARLLISIPPSKARFTFLDPVALGESFAAFMHLGDEFEQLVGERIWTDPRAIEQRLLDISEHMETVIQKYLRNEFEDIDAYNDAAGEIAEPYRFLVCADFPANFSEQAAARMLSILRAGQRCGVHVILLRDQKAALPDGISADEIAASCQIVRAEKGTTGSFRFASGPYAALPLKLDSPLPDAELIPLLTRIGRVAKTAARVEVPFDAIAPGGNAFWSLSSAKNLRVPVGRAGATRLQQFLLGEGTSQHALIAGKTGSGKSTLLHAIITGIACWYSPAEVELWLVDFKKGVEFKTYAEHALPHARAVAIESDREFGLSVLEGLDAELSRRGELFREAGVQDIASYRKVRPDARMPRVLLVIDEFQEFFLDDDRVAQNASMLLDRLVRQGRAFGMHALLGSQTLGGAYSLARSTMGQMGVRIALQCSEADSQLILSDENLAARLLSRPGEAIYNDAGGRLEGNSPFQVAYLPDEKRDMWLDEVERRAKGAFDTLPRIVFEGDARAPIRLSPAVRGGMQPDPRGNVRLWFGEAVAIKDPTCARLARAAGANVACISPRDDQAVSTSAAMLLAIAAEAPDAVIDVFDGTPADAPEHGALQRIATDRGVKANFVPYREIDAKLSEIAQDVTDRADNPGRPRRFVLIHQLQRYRTLRRNEDDFSFGASDAPPSPDKLLGGIVREGPVAGVHVLVMADTLASLQRSFDRNALREFDWKVLFQISPADSSTLIDSPAASRLGTNRGLLHSEELGLLEKFRPYAM
jgi:ABC-type multidrug transport system fused ATPase/permease subunit